MTAGTNNNPTTNQPLARRVEEWHPFLGSPARARPGLVSEEKLNGKKKIHRRRSEGNYQG